MAGYRLLLDDTANTLIRRARGFRNLVVAVVLVAFGAVAGAVALLSLRPLVILSLLGPAYVVFLWHDNRVLADWRRSLADAWQRREIDFSAFRQALGANQALPSATVQGMLATLPLARDLTVEQGWSAGTRAAIAQALEVRDSGHTESLAGRGAGVTSVTLAMVFAILFRTWLPLFGCALVPVLILLCAWSRRRRMSRAVTRIAGLLQVGDCAIDQYREGLAALDWGAGAGCDKVRLLDLGV